MVLLQGVLFGATAVFGTSAAVPVASQHFTRRRALAIGIVASGSSAGGVCLPIMFSHLVPRLGFGWTLRIAALISLGCYAVAMLISTPKHPRKPVKSIWSVADFSGFRDRRYVTLALANLVGNFGLYIPFYYLGTFRAADEPDAALPVPASLQANPDSQSPTLQLDTPRPRSGTTCFLSSTGRASSVESCECLSSVPSLERKPADSSQRRFRR